MFSFVSGWFCCSVSGRSVYVVEHIHSMFPCIAEQSFDIRTYHSLLVSELFPGLGYYSAAAGIFIDVFFIHMFLHFHFY